LSSNTLITSEKNFKATVETKKQKLKTLLSRLFFWRADQFLSDLRYLSSRKSPGKLLDVGCGNGLFLKEARDYGWEVKGCDYDEASVEVANREFNVNVNVNVDVGALHSIKYERNSFDAVTLSNVIEYLDDPLGLMKEAYRVLDDGGRFVSVSPNPKSILHKRYGNFWRGLEPPRHLILLHHQTLNNLAKQAGFTKVFSFTSASGLELAEIASQEIVHKANVTDIDTSPLSKTSIIICRLASLLGFSTGEYCVVIADK
jgi:SAM-dependent methyltransferase